MTWQSEVWNLWKEHEITALQNTGLLCTLSTCGTVISNRVTVTLVSMRYQLQFDIYTIDKNNFIFKDQKSKKSQKRRIMSEWELTYDSDGHT